MLEVEHMLAPLMAAFMPRDLFAAVPDLDMQRPDPRFHPAARLHRHRVEIRLHRDPALLVDQWEGDIGNIEPLGRAGQQMFALHRHQSADRLNPSGQNPRLITPAMSDEACVQCVKISHARHWHQVVTPEISAFSRNATLLMTLSECAEFGGKPPMRAERQEPHRLLAPMAAQDLTYRTRQIVVAQQAKHPTEISERQLVRLEKRLLGHVQIRPVKRRPARHRAHREHLPPCSARHQNRPRLHTNRPAPPGPAHSFAARTSHAAAAAPVITYLAGYTFCQSEF
ncbi:MAG TPA: hypothetical protein VMV54_00680 [Acidocella sp.]|nr:hypothetical protein [Acidocella sp.]